MNLLSSTLCWCVLQTTLLAILTLALSARPWRLGGAWVPLFGLIGVALITAFAFLPIPWSWHINAIGPFAVNSVESTDATETIGRPNQIADSDSGSAEHLSSTPEGIDLATVWLSGFLDELRKPFTSTESGWPKSPLSIAVLGIFGIGMAVGAVRLIVGLRATRKLIQSGKPINEARVDELMDVLQAKLRVNRSIDIFETDRLSTAATVGAWKSCILLPGHWRQWNEAELNAVLAHELAHIAHGDFAAVLVSQLSIVVHFYHPLVHWLARRLRLEQELAADAVAAQLAGGERTYMKVLAKLALEHQDRFVGWPARAFLPTRQTFLRRLEMLRDGNGSSPGRVSRGRWFALIAIGTAFMALVSLKPPGERAVAQDTVPVPNAKNHSPYDLRFFSDNGGIVIGARPAELLANKQLAKIAGEFQEQKFLAIGIALADIEQVVVNMESSSPQPSAVYLRCSKSIDGLQLPSDAKPVKLAGVEILELPGNNCIWKPDNQSLVFGSKRNVERFIQGRQAEKRLTETELWKKLSDQPLLVVGDGKLARNWLRPDSPFHLTLVSPIVQELETFGLALSFDKELSIAAIAQSTDEKGATIIRETSQAALVLAKNGLRELKIPSEPSGMKNTFQDLQAVGSKLVEGIQWKTDGESVSLSSNIQVEETLLNSLASLVMASRRGAERLQSANNLKQLGLAFHNFHEAYNQFPNPTMSPNPEHKHPVSWRVSILPFIDQDAVYKQYRFDEPWDGPNNSKLLAKMPALYRHPDAKSDSSETNYVVLTGDETIFKPNKKSRISDILDGTSNTIMIVESKTSIPWTKPEDIAYASDKPLPSFGGFSDVGFQAVFADGHVSFIGKTIDERILRALYTSKGGEVVDTTTIPTSTSK